jgi:hypothetical protein
MFEDLFAELSTPYLNVMNKERSNQRKGVPELGDQAVDAWPASVHQQAKIRREAKRESDK